MSFDSRRLDRIPPKPDSKTPRPVPSHAKSSPSQTKSSSTLVESIQAPESKERRKSNVIILEPTENGVSSWSSVELGSIKSFDTSPSKQFGRYESWVGNPVFSDILFLVGPEKTTIPAHRVILASSECIFKDLLLSDDSTTFLSALASPASSVFSFQETVVNQTSKPKTTPIVPPKPSQHSSPKPRSNTITVSSPSSSTNTSGPKSSASIRASNSNSSINNKPNPTSSVSSHSPKTNSELTSPREIFDITLPIVLEDVKPEIFLKLLSFLYCNRISLHFDNVADYIVADYNIILDLLDLSDRFRVPSLSKLLIHFLETDSNSISIIGPEIIRQLKNKLFPSSSSLQYPISSSSSSSPSSSPSLQSNLTPIAESQLQNVNIKSTASVTSLSPQDSHENDDDDAVQYNITSKSIEFSDTIKKRIKEAKLRIEEQARKMKADSEELNWICSKHDLIPSRTNHTASSYGNALVIIGGHDGNGNPVGSGVEFLIESNNISNSTISQGAVYQPVTLQSFSSNSNSSNLSNSTLNGSNNLQNSSSNQNTSSNNNSSSSGNNNNNNSSNNSNNNANNSDNMETLSSSSSSSNLSTASSSSLSTNSSISSSSLVWSETKKTGVGPKSIHSHATCRIGNRFYSYGGIVDGERSAKMFIVAVINDETVHWSIPRMTGDLPPPLSHHTLLRYDKNLILFGGYDGIRAVSDIWIMETDTNKWRKLETKPSISSHQKEFGQDTSVHNPPFHVSPRYGHCAIIVGSNMIVLGGHDHLGNYFNDLVAFNFETNSWKNIPIKATVPRMAYHNAVRVGRNILVYGGRRKSGQLTKELWKLILDENLEEILWTKVRCNAAPHERYGHTVNRIGSKIYVVGGLNDRGKALGDLCEANTVKLPLENARMIDHGELEISSLVGMGNFSQVRRGLWNNNVIAIKLIKTSLKVEQQSGPKGKEKQKLDKQKVIKDFKAEVELLSQLKHPNLVNFLGYCLEPNAIVMEYLPQNLHDYLVEHRGSLDKQQSLDFAYDIARGMEYLHRNSIIHRDLKSFNILLDENLNVKIADFGIARVKSNTSTMTTTGTIAWTAPEILRHESYDEKSDVYSYAIVLWEIVSEGEIPFDDFQSPMEAGIAVATGQLRPSLPANVDPNWAQLIEKCWKEDPQSRPCFTEIMDQIKKFA